MVSEIFRWRNEETGTAGQKLSVDSDNPRPHTARQTRDLIEAYGIDHALHPPYSRDIAPSDFFLFGDPKDRLQRRDFEDGDQLFDAVLSLAGTIEKVTLQRVFGEWMEKLRKCIDTKSEHVGSPN
jgi:histone-lysine N-methyltransferase SETMAR